ncbi:MAG: enolase [Candidatus Woesearchaeota archaeon]|nr:MAG: enolase [Candidatus Woesearchaeota archaeon]
MSILDIKAFKVLNSRSDPTIGVQVKTEKGKAWAAAPSGASVGKAEAKAYPHGIDAAIAHINSKADKLKKIDIEEFKDLKKIESEINISKSGANATIALEYAFLKGLALEKQEPIWRVINPKAKKMPKLLSNVVGGGSHAAGGLDIQEILVYSNSKTFADGAFLNAEIHKKIKLKLEKKDSYFIGGKTDEGAWTTYLSDLEALRLVRDVIDHEKTKMYMGIDLAASQLYKNEQYIWKNYAYKSRKKSFTQQEHIDLVKDVIKRFKLKYVEDPVYEDDFKGFAELNKLDTDVCGDDLTATNVERIRRAIRTKSISAIIIKPNQVGSVVKTIDAINLAKRAGLKIAFSHRSGSTEDATLVHIAKAFEADFVKIGISGGERTVKINELIRIEQGL